MEEVFGTTLVHPERDAALAQAILDLQTWREHGYQVTSIFDPSYPHHLAGVYEAPAVLFSIGDLQPADTGVNVVGSRHAPGRPRYRAHRGLTVISGLVAGIDATAHSAALATSGHTVAVMRTGLDHTHPTTHRRARVAVKTSD